jgi:hypothetical protein
MMISKSATERSLNRGAYFKKGSIFLERGQRGRKGTPGVGAGQSHPDTLEGGSGVPSGTGGKVQKSRLIDAEFRSRACFPTIVSGRSSYSQHYPKSFVHSKAYAIIYRFWVHFWSNTSIFPGGSSD